MDQVKNTALHMACEDGNVEIAKMLVEAGADPDALNKWEKTPAQMADPAVASAVQGRMQVP
jgi:ankyrin repeat protein